MAFVGRRYNLLNFPIKLANCHIVMLPCIVSYRYYRSDPKVTNVTLVLEQLKSLKKWVLYLSYHIYWHNPPLRAELKLKRISYNNRL